MASDKTEAPTAKRLLDARKKGQVARSRDLSTASALLAAAILASFAMGPWHARLLELSTELWTHPERSPIEALSWASNEVVGLLIVSVLPIPVLIALVTLVQFRPSFYLESVKVRWERIDPTEGIKRLFTFRSVYEVGKSLVLILGIGTAAWGLYDVAAPGVFRLFRIEVGRAWHWVGGQATELIWAVVPIVAFVGVADLLYQRWKHHEDLKMSRDEVRREQREAEGDPAAKQARTRAYQEMMAHAVLEAVRGADVLIVNPTHVAVALRYDQDDEDAAPEVIASGQDHLAKRMIDAAKEAGVPVMQDIPLARALLLLEVGEEIPETLYTAVAEVLRAAWALRDEDGSDDVDSEEESDG